MMVDSDIHTTLDGHREDEPDGARMRRVQSHPVCCHWGTVFCEVIAPQD